MSDFKSTLKDIKSHGYFVFHIDSVSPQEPADKDYGALQELVRNNSVHLRGWPLPYVPTHNKNQGLHNIDAGIQAWCNHGMEKEIWRLFFDGEFIYYSAVNEDWFRGDDWIGSGSPLSSIEPGTILNAVGSVIYKITEMLEFARNLALVEFLKGDVRIRVELRGMQDRRLAVLEPNRMPLNPFYIAQQDTITPLDIAISTKELRLKSNELAAKAIIATFRMFQWNTVGESQIVDEQEKLFKRQF
jgi:hypothetical protein